MKVIITMLVVTVSPIINETNCGVVDNVYGRVSNTTQAIKEDVYGWWSYGKDAIMGSKDEDQRARNANENTEKEDGMIAGLYHKLRGGVSAGYMKVHDVVLGEESDPNKGIIRTLFERAMNRLSQVKEFVFGHDNAVDQTQSKEKEENVREQVLKVLFGNKTDLFTEESEKKALDSLRTKLTQAGDGVLQLAENERNVIKKAYESIYNKADELKSQADKSTDEVKNKVQENIEKTQEFIQDASKKVNDGVQNLQDDVKKSVNDIDKKVQSE